MVRVLLVRHGLTKSNTRDFRAGFAAQRERLQQGDVWRLTRAWAEEEPRVSAWHESARDIEVSGDSELNEVGLEEAEALAEYWAPILAQKAASGQLSVYCSPMRRCLQTLHPLMRRLGPHGIGATVMHDLHEVGGLCAPVDRDWFERELDPLTAELQGQASGGRKPDRALEERYRSTLRGRGFTRAGLAGREIRERFAWVTAFDARMPTDPDVCWCAGGWERSPKRIHRRISSVCDWLRSLAARLGEQHVVLLVSHGDTAARIALGLVGVDYERFGTDLQNTAVSQVTIPRDPTQRTMLNFLNRTPHLVLSKHDARNLQYYWLNAGLLKMPSRSKASEATSIFPRTFEKSGLLPEYVSKL